MKSMQLLVALVLLLNLLPQTQSTKKRSTTPAGIHLNKNGRTDIYENPKIDIEIRLTDLLSQMNPEGKTCQTATL